MWKWISMILVLAVGAYSVYWYFAVYQPQQQAYGNLRQALQDANAQGQKVADKVKSSEAGYQSAPPTPASVTNTPSSGGITQTITASNATLGASFSIQLPSTWKEADSDSWATANETYLAMDVPPSNPSDLSQLSLTVTYYTDDPSKVDSLLRNQVTSSLQGLTNIALTPIQVSGADEAIMGTATQNLKGNEFTYIEVRVYKAGSDFNSHVYTASFSAESASPAVAAMKQAISTIKILK